MSTLSTKKEFVQWVQHLNSISEMILMNESLESTTNVILETLNTNLSSLFLIYLRVDSEQKNLQLHSFSQKLFPKVNRFIKFNLYNIKYPLTNTIPLITKCLSKNQTLSSTHLRDFFYPVFKWKKILDMIQSLLNINYCMATPMKVDIKTSGVLFAATTKKRFLPLEVELIKFYANQLRIAYDNKKKIDELQAQYLVEKETSAILAHELKTPISIASNSIVLASDSLSGEKKEHTIQTMKQAQEAVKRLNVICHSVLALREVETQKLSAIHILHLEDSFLPILKNFEQSAREKKLDFSYKMKFRSGKFYGGGAQFEQIITILLDNAIKYTEKGKVGIDLVSDGKKLKGSVYNTGYKIPPDKRKVIFERFYRHRSDDNKMLSKSSGLGLGLYIALKLVEHLDGKIKVIDGPKHKGNMFVVEIPIYTSRDAA